MDSNGLRNRRLSYGALLAPGLVCLVLYGLSSQFLPLLLERAFLGRVVWIVKVTSGFPLVFLFPGTVVAARVIGTKKIKLTLFLFIAVGIQYLMLVASTTLAKLFNVVIDGNGFLAVEIALFVIAGFLYRRGRSVEVLNDLNALLLITVALVLMVCAALYWNRMNLRVGNYWLAEKMEQIKFQEKKLPSGAVSLLYGDGLEENGGGEHAIRGSEATISVRNLTRVGIDYHLLYFVRSNAPGLVRVSLNGELLGTERIPLGFFKAGATHVFGLQAIYSSDVRLNPGINRLAVKFVPEAPMDDTIPCWDIQDFSGMSRRQFIAAFRRDNDVLNIGHMYDIREMRALAKGLMAKPYLWADRFSTGGRVGYIAMSLPASHYQDMLVLAAVGSFPLCLNLLFVLRIYLMIIALAYLVSWRSSQIRGWGLVVLLVVTVAYFSVAINCTFQIFPDTFLFMCFFISLVFLLERHNVLYMVFAIMASLSRVVGAELVFITIFAYGFLFHERKRLFMLFLLYAGVLAVFAFGVYQLGRAQGLLEVWGRELKGEYLYKSIDEVPMSFTTYDNLRNLFLWWLVGACFLPFGLRFRRGDKLGQLLIVTLIVFLGIVLISAESRVYRSHYAAPLTLLTLAAVLRYWFCKSGPKSNREKCTRLALIFVAIVSTIYLLLYPFDYPEYNTLWPGGYYLLSGLHETIGRSIVK